MYKALQVDASVLACDQNGEGQSRVVVVSFAGLHGYRS